MVALGVESPADALAQIRRLPPVVMLLAALLVMGEAVPIAGTIPKGAKLALATGTPASSATPTSSPPQDDLQHIGFGGAIHSLAACTACSSGGA